MANFFKDIAAENAAWDRVRDAFLKKGYPEWAVILGQRMGKLEEMLQVDPSLVMARYPKVIGMALADPKVKVGSEIVDLRFRVSGLYLAGSRDIQAWTEVRREAERAFERYITISGQYSLRKAEAMEKYGNYIILETATLWNGVAPVRKTIEDDNPFFSVSFTQPDVLSYLELELRREEIQRLWADQYRYTMKFTNQDGFAECKKVTDELRTLVESSNDSWMDVLSVVVDIAQRLGEVRLVSHAMASLKRPFEDLHRRNYMSSIWEQLSK